MSQPVSFAPQQWNISSVQSERIVWVEMTCGPSVINMLCEEERRRPTWSSSPVLLLKQKKQDDVLTALTHGYYYIITSKVVRSGFLRRWSSCPILCTCWRKCILFMCYLWCKTGLQSSEQYPAKGILKINFIESHHCFLMQTALEMQLSLWFRSQENVLTP